MKTRQSARLIVVNEQQQIFLFKYEDAVPLDPAKPDLRVYWATPGGGVKEGETFEQAALRELWEETAISEVDLGPCVWLREREFVLRGERTLTHERYFLARVRTNTISLHRQERSEMVAYRGHRWWSLEELRASQEIFVPEGFVSLVAALLSGAIPERPLLIEG
ncbi:NUDIX hydrolase [Thermogemmatispora sp.]|uniref:NUDIX hydrolase n=1 Tax=Thermogemmatispora sp. TaxID=1968838 RepID=UPI0035E44C62